MEKETDDNSNSNFKFDNYPELNNFYEYIHNDFSSEYYILYQNELYAFKNNKSLLKYKKKKKWNTNEYKLYIAEYVKEYSIITHY